MLDDHDGERTFVAIYEAGEEARAGLLALAAEQHVSAAHFTAVGGFARAVLGYFDRHTKQYTPIPVDEQVEVLSFIGDVALKADGSPEVHAHVVVGRADGSTRGGHLLEGHVWPTLEVMLTDTPQHLRRVYDEASGLALIDPQARS
ncbi:MAG: DNA-binding protein [Chloroflexota bacterium]|nr:DNA-binding protein [Chloroflexota bacterium]